MKTGGEEEGRKGAMVVRTEEGRPQGGWESDTSASRCHSSPPTSSCSPPVTSNLSISDAGLGKSRPQEGVEADVKIKDQSPTDSGGRNGPLCGGPLCGGRCVGGSGAGAD